MISNLSIWATLLYDKILKLQFFFVERTEIYELTTLKQGLGYCARYILQNGPVCTKSMREIQNEQGTCKCFKTLSHHITQRSASFEFLRCVVLCKAII